MQVMQTFFRSFNLPNFTGMKFLTQNVIPIVFDNGNVASNPVNMLGIYNAGIGSRAGISGLMNGSGGLQSTSSVPGGGKFPFGISANADTSNLSTSRVVIKY